VPTKIGVEEVSIVKMNRCTVRFSIWGMSLIQYDFTSSAGREARNPSGLRERILAENWKAA
jgi:hypothetical protein